MSDDPPSLEIQSRNASDPAPRSEARYPSFEIRSARDPAPRSFPDSLDGFGRYLERLASHLSSFDPTSVPETFTFHLHATPPFSDAERFNLSNGVRIEERDGGFAVTNFHIRLAEPDRSRRACAGAMNKEIAELLAAHEPPTRLEYRLRFIKEVQFERPDANNEGHWGERDYEIVPHFAPVERSPGSLAIHPDVFLSFLESFMASYHELFGVQWGNIVAEGVGASPGTATGVVRYVDPTDGTSIDGVEPGDIVVAEYTTPLLVPAIKRAGGVVTAEGGQLCHAALVARELETPAVVGVEDLEALEEGTRVTISGREGRIEGARWR